MKTVSLICQECMDPVDVPLSDSSAFMHCAKCKSTMQPKPLAYDEMENYSSYRAGGIPRLPPGERWRPMPPPNREIR